MARTAFVGLGVMGFPMAGHLKRAGHEVAVFNRSPAKAQAWVAKHGGRAAPTPAQAAEGAEFVMICVGNDADLRAVTLGPEGVFAAMAPGAVCVDHTTASAAVARELAAEAARRGFFFIDAPVSGGQAGAENGALAIMCGGDPAAYDRAEPVMAAYAKLCRRLGDSGAGQLCKMVNQICIAGVVQGLSEALAFADKAGLDAQAVIDVVSKGAAQSWQMENRHGWMAEGLASGAFQPDRGFAVDWMRKDLGIVLDESRRNGAKLPLTALVDQFYADVQSMGGGRWDTSSLIMRLKD
ncbi:NAD(P)-dependent oxidoreductase [Neomegalonema perideroedes]|uniref:NAD(P)-dependent oxidoreductase n=1 Tax=Neomegalonema perideroedes TaxID=217219 RepID=UPI00036907A8|nr:NAD(P)-dependent oxidoreductase [Neomegalonema perideroedes]